MEMLTQPCPLSIRVVVPMVVFALVVPFYIYIGIFITPGRTLHSPELPLDRLIALQPVWSLVYGSHILLFVLPFLLVRRQEHIRRTILALLMVWTVSFVGFLAYPTVAPRPTSVVGDGFFPWVLQLIYSADPPYNCFPSLHVAHAFVSSLTCYRVHRGAGVITSLWAALIAVSTLYTKQHYLIDVIAGIFLACLVYVIFLRNFAHEQIPAPDRILAPVLTLSFIGIHLLTVTCFWAAYQLRSVP